MKKLGWTTALAVVAWGAWRAIRRGARRDAAVWAAATDPAT